MLHGALFEKTAPLDPLQKLLIKAVMVCLKILLICKPSMPLELSFKIIALLKKTLNNIIIRS
jgi:hypothetical protein